MGNYATTADLKARFEDDAAVAELTDTASSGVPDEDVLDEVINHAEGQIDGACAVRYLIPIAVADHAGLAAIMKSNTLDIAVYHLYVRHHSVTEDIQNTHDKVLDWMEKVSEGKALLPSPDTEPSTESREPILTIGMADVDSADSNRIFNRETQGAL